MHELPEATMSDQTSNIAGALAARFYDATLGRMGTDEAEVYSVLEEVHRIGAKDGFESMLVIHPGMRRSGFLSDPANLVPAILGEEMSGTELRKAQEIWADGKATYSASNVDYLIQGMINGFGDVGELFHEHPLAAGGAALAVGGIFLAGAIFEIPAILIGGTFLAVGVGAFEAASAVYHGIKATAAEDRRTETAHMEEAGRHISGFAMAATAAKAAAGPAFRSAVGVRSAARIDAAAKGGKQTAKAAVNSGAILRNIFTPSRRMCDRTAMNVLAELKAAGGKKAQGEVMRNLLGLPEGLGKLSLDHVQQAILREIIANPSMHSTVRREALIALDRAGALMLGSKGKDVALIGEVLFGKSSVKGSIATDKDAAMLLDYSVRLLEKSRDPRALEMMRAAYWKNTNEVRGATGQAVKMQVLEDLAKAISKKDPSFTKQQ